MSTLREALFGAPQPAKLLAKRDAQGPIRFLATPRYGDYLRANAAAALGELGDPEAVEPLIAALDDHSPLVRARAAEALGRLGESNALAPLAALLGDADREVRDAAAEGLSQSGDPQYVAALLAAGQDYAIRRMGSTAAVGPAATAG